METSKHQGPGMDTIKKGIHTTILLTMEEFVGMSPAALKHTSAKEAINASLTEIFTWNQVERRYSLLQGDVFVEGTPSMIRFDVSTGAIKLMAGVSINNKIQPILEIKVNDVDFHSASDFKYDIIFSDEDTMLRLSPIGQNLSKLTLGELEKRHQKSLDDMLVLYHKNLQAGNISTFFFNRVKDLIRHRNSVPPKPDPTIKGFKYTPLTYTESEEEYELLREFISEANGAEAWLKRELAELVHATATGYYIMLMSLMRRFVEIPPQEVAGETKKNILSSLKIPTTYKYNGKVNLMDNRVFKLTTTAHEKKEFIRHIGRWLVRGHWRRVPESDKRIWINQYEKGKPDAEASDRIYTNVGIDNQNN